MLTDEVTGPGSWCLCGWGLTLGMSVFQGGGEGGAGPSFLGHMGLGVEMGPSVAVEALVIWAVAVVLEQGEQVRPVLKEGRKVGQVVWSGGAHSFTSCLPEGGVLGSQATGAMDLWAMGRAARVSCQHWGRGCAFREARLGRPAP